MGMEICYIHKFQQKLTFPILKGSYATPCAAGSGARAYIYDGQIRKLTWNKSGSQEVFFAINDRR